MADIPTTNLDAGTDSPAAARAQLLAVVQRVNSLAASTAGSGADLVYGVSRVVSSIALLRTLPAGGSNCVFVTGYYAPGDGGGGQYVCHTSDTTGADNGGTVIVGASGARWKLMHSGRISVKQFGAKGDGIADDAPAFRACVDYCVGPQYTVAVSAPATYYLIKSTIPIYNGTKIEGESSGQFVQAYSQIPKFSRVHFVPTAANTDLFVPTRYGNTDPFIELVSVSGLYCSAGAGARFCFNNAGAIYSTFRDLGIMDFVAGFNIALSIQNRYENVIIKGSTTAPVIYSSMSDVATCDVWDQCTFFSSPQGPYLQGCVGIRFLNCIWEQLENYGLHLARDCHSIEVVGGYGEDVPYANNASGAMFRVGYDVGTGLPVDVALRIIGGAWNGRNAGTVGSFIDCDYCNGIVVSGPTHNRFTTILKTSANTRVNSVVWMGSNGFGFTTFATDPSRLSGVYPNGVLNTGNNMQTMRIPSIVANSMTAADGNGSAIDLSGAAVMLKPGAANAIYTDTDNAVDLGLASARFRSVNAGVLRASAAASAAGGGTLTLGGTSASAAAAGGATALPATPLGYLIGYLGGTPIKIPYYNA